MPSPEWYLKPWDTYQSFQGPAIKVEIDPALIAGGRGTFGPVLFLPYTLPKPEEASASLHLLSLEGWIGYGNISEADARLLIPSQIIWPDNRSRLQVPLTDAQIEAIEEARKGSQVNLTVWLGGLASVDQGLVPIRSTSSGFTIERERWLTVLQQLGAGTKRLVELPEPHLPQGDQRWAECLRLLDGATQFYRRVEYEQVLVNCREIVEGIPQVLCAVWGLPQKRSNQAFEGWMQELENRLSATWQNDDLTPGMLRTMLTGAWHWSAPAPHYGTGIPLREDVAFALGLCTDLLQFAGQVLRAHPDPIVRQREETI
jgi:hypothetical protein